MKNAGSTPAQFEVVKRDIDGDRYAHVLTAENRGYAMDWATRYAREGKPGDVFGVYEQSAGAKPTSGAEPAGRLLYECESEFARLGPKMQRILSKGGDA